jgi:hypothetical protein
MAFTLADYFQSMSDQWEQRNPELAAQATADAQTSYDRAWAANPLAAQYLQANPFNPALTGADAQAQWNNFLQGGGQGLMDYYGTNFDWGNLSADPTYKNDFTNLLGQDAYGALSAAKAYEADQAKAGDWKTKFLEPLIKGTVLGGMGAGLFQGLLSGAGAGGTGATSATGATTYPLGTNPAAGGALTSGAATPLGTTAAGAAAGAGTVSNSIFGNLTGSAWGDLARNLLTPQNLLGLGATFLQNSQNDPLGVEGIQRNALNSFDASMAQLGPVFQQFLSQAGNEMGNLPDVESIRGMLDEAALPAEQRRLNSIANRLQVQGRRGPNDTVSGNVFGRFMEESNNAALRRHLSAFELSDALRTSAVGRSSSLLSPLINTTIARGNLGLGVGSNLVNLGTQITNPFDAFGQWLQGQG